MSSTTLGNHSIMSCSPNDPLAHLVEVATALARMPQESGPARTVSSSSSSVGITTTTTTAQPAALGDSDYLSVVSNDEDESQKRTLSSPAASSQPYSKREIFPQRLLAILSDPSLCDVVAWLPHGKSFVIIRPDVFTEQVLPKYLPPTDARSSTKYASFTRKLNRWGFRQATRGPDTGAFSHPLFQKDKPELCHGMVCQRSRETGSSPEKATKTQQQQRKSETTTTTKSSKTTTTPTRTATTPTFMPSDASSSLQDAATVVEPAVYHIPSGISTNKTLVQAVLQQRDDMERIQAAKAMLYDSYMKVLHNNNGPQDQDSCC